MKKILTILAFCFSFITAFSQQNPIRMARPFDFLKYIIVRDSIQAPIYFQGSDTLATQQYVRLHAGTGSGSGYTAAAPIYIDGSGKIYLDSLNFRKMDSLYVVTDSTFIIKIGTVYTSFKMRGALFSFNGRNGAITLTSADVTNALGYVPESLANKSSSTTLGTSNTLYPTQGAVKTYVDNGLSGKLNSTDTVGFLKSVATDATLTGQGTAADPLHVVVSGTGYDSTVMQSKYQTDTAKVNLRNEIATGAGVQTASGDASGTASGSNLPLTLATVNSNVFGSQTALKITVNGKGLVLSATPIAASDIKSILGYTPYDSTNPKNYVALTTLSAVSPLSYNNTSGQFSFNTSQGGDLTGTYPNPTVSKLLGHPIDTTSNGQNYLFVYDSTNHKFILASPSFLGLAGTVGNSTAGNRVAYYQNAGDTVKALPAITPNYALISDGNGLPVASSISATKLGYLTDVTSNLKAYIDGAVGTKMGNYFYVTSDSLKTVWYIGANVLNQVGASATLSGLMTAPDKRFLDSLNNGTKPLGSGTVSNSASGNRLTYYSVSGNTVQALAAITGNKAIASDANGLPVASTTTDTELGYVHGVTSAIQSQLDSKLISIGIAATASTTNVTLTPTGAYTGIPAWGTGIINGADATHAGLMIASDKSYLDSLHNGLIPTGSGSVTSVSAGSLTPLFSSSVSNATTTPSISFSLSNAGAHTFFGNFTGSSAAPSYGTPSLTADFLNQGTTTTLLHGNAAGALSWGAVNLTADVSGILPATNGGTGNAFTSFSGPTTSIKTFTLPNANATILTTASPVTASQGGTGQSTYTVGDILYASTTSALSKLSAGTSGYILTSNGPGVAPSWQAAPSGGGSGTVTSFSSGNLSPLFTTSVATATTTPALSFTISNAGAHTFFGNFTGASAAPSYGTPSLTADFSNQGTTTTVLHGNAAGSLSFSSVSLTSDISGILGGSNGGTNNAFMQFTGPTTATKTFTLPDASATILTTNSLVTVAQGGSGAGTLTGYLKGNGTSPFTASSTIPFTDVTGTVPVTQGGLGLTSVTAGSILYASAANTYSALASAATGNVLLSGTSPSWGKVGLTTAVSGILPAANGGTGNGFTAFSGPATSTKTFTLPNASATILTTNALVTVAQGGTGASTLTGYVKGSGTSAFTASSTIPFTDVTGTVPIAQGGTNATTAAAAINNLLPSQVGNSGKVLTTDGTNPSWASSATEYDVSFTSSDASALNVDTVLLSPGTTVTVTIMDFLAIKSDGSASYQAKKSITVLQNASGTDYTGTIRVNEADQYLGSGLSTATVTFVVSGNYIFIRWTGEAATTIDGQCHYRVEKKNNAA